MKASLVISHYVTDDPRPQDGGYQRTWLGHGLTVPLFLAASLLGMLLLLWCPVPLRWPLRVVNGGLILGAALAGYCQLRQTAPIHRFRALLSILLSFIVTALIVTTGHSTWKSKRDQAYGYVPTPSSTVAPRRVAELARELEERGITLTVFALPSFETLFPEKRDPNDLENSVEMRYVAESLGRISGSGVATWDMYPLFDQHARNPALWKSDEVHLTKDGVTEISALLAAKLDELGLNGNPESQSHGKVVIMGNCFANQFVEGLLENHPQWSDLRGLSVLGDEGRAADSLFLFPDLYLKDTRHVIWMMPYSLLRTNSLAPMNATPNLDDSVVKTATIRVESALEWNNDEGKSRLKTMAYPNGLVNLTGRVIAGSDFPEGEELTAQGYGVQGRQFTPLGRIGVGKRIRVNLIPLEYYLSQHPKVASEYLLNDSAVGPENHFWIHSWTFER